MQIKRPNFMRKMTRAIVVGVVASVSCAALAAPASGKLTTITIGTFPHLIGALPLVVANGEGFFAKQGLKVDFVKAKNGPELIGGLVGGTSEIAMAWPGTAMPALKAGAHLKLLPPYQHGSFQLAATKASGIKTVKGLVGKTIGVPVRGGASENFIDAVLRQHGVDPKDVTFIGMGGAAALEAAFLNGRVDASIGSPEGTVLTNQNGGHPVVLASALAGTAGERGKQGIGSFYVTTPKAYKQHGKAIGGFCRAMRQAVHWIADKHNKAGVVKYMEHSLGLKKPGAEKVYDIYSDTWFTHLDKAQWNANVGFVLGKKASISYDHVLNNCGS